MACSRLSGFQEILFLSWLIERNVINGFRCWTACKAVCKVPLQQVLNFLKNPILFEIFLTAVVLRHLESTRFASLWRTSTQDLGLFFFFNAKNTLVYVNVSSHVDSAISNIIY